MATCTTDVTLISDDEYIGDSLTKINQNFQNLQASTCELKNKLDEQIQIRTFFYYGPNTPSDPQDGTAGMDNNALTRPSNTTIQSFVNSVSGLNLKQVSESGDIAYVIYQKTGWYTPPVTEYIREGSGQVPFSRIETYTISYYVQDPVPVSSEGGSGSKKRKIAIAGKCWVAREVYNDYSPKWEIFRDWLFDSGKGPNRLQTLYTNYGERFANWISNKTTIKKYLQKLFDIIVTKESLDTASFVSTPTGPVKTQNLKPGDVIYGYDHITGKSKECRVLKNASIKNILLTKIYHEFGELILPLDQKVYVEDGNTGESLQYVRAESLKPGDFIFLDSNEKTRILKIKTFKSKTPIQKLEVEENHNYMLNGVKVHNGWVSETRTRIVTYYVGYTWKTTIEDTYKQYEPIFVIYKLTYDGSEYVMDSGFPKYSRASTESTSNWNNPQLWTTY